jgi:serine phosphatase RsbU (regulator of sigma subunit)
MPLIRIQYNDGREAVEVTLDKPEAVIGREAACDVALDDAVTSRRHARLYRDAEGAYWIQDLRSKNGTILNDQPVLTSRVRDGDRIIIGGCELCFCDEAEPSIILSDVKEESTLGTTSAWTPQQALSLAQRRLEKLYELNERLTGRFDRDDLLNEILLICAEALRFERAGVAVWHGAPHQPQWIKVRQFAHLPGGGVQVREDRGEVEIRISRSLVDRALHKGERILVNDTADKAFDPTMSMVSNNIRSAMCVPMEYHNTVRGVIYGDRITSTGAYTKEDIDFFAALGRLGAMGLANVQLVEEIKSRQQVDLQLDLARQIQGGLLPSEPLILKRNDGTPFLTVDALNDPGQRVSGDYFDYYRRPDGLVMTIIADVSGKGIPASLLMANLQAAVHVMLRDETDLVVAAKRLNALVSQNVSEGRFITAIFGLLDIEARRFRYVNAGHFLPFVFRGTDRIEEPSGEGTLPLGIEPEFAYEIGEIELPDRPSTLVYYTDGVIDAQNEQGECYGPARLSTALESSKDQPPGELIARLRRSIKQFTRATAQTDDITLLAMRLD